MATPAFADIEVTLSGQVEFGTKIHDEDTIVGSNRGYFFFMDSETEIFAEGAADNGLNYSAKVELEVDADGKGDSAGANADEAVVAFWGGFGRFELGREDGAEDVMYVGGEDFQSGTGGIDGDTENLNLSSINDSADAAKITYFTPRVAGFQLGASYSPDEADDEQGIDDDGTFEDFFGLGANFTTGFAGADVTVSGVAAFASDDAGGDDLEDYAIGLGLEFAGLGLGAGYIIRNDANEGDGFNLGAKYGFGPASVSAGYSYDDVDAADDTGVFAVSADYGLFPGVTLKGDVSFNDNDADAGGDSTTAGVVTIQVDY